MSLERNSPVEQNVCVRVCYSKSTKEKQVDHHEENPTPVECRKYRVKVHKPLQEHFFFFLE